MKKIILAFVILFICSSYGSIHSQVMQADLVGVWDGGLAFDGQYHEKRFEIIFSDKEFYIHYGPNHYPQYTGYSLKKDEITILRNDKYAKNKSFRPKFKIIKLDENDLILEALNWPAVYITSVIATPNQNTEEIIFLDDNKTDLTDGGTLNTQLNLKRKK